MEGRASRSRSAWLFGGAISTCLVVAVVVLGRGTAAGSVPNALTATDPPPTPTTTVTVLTTIRSYTPVPIYETTTTTVTVTKTSTTVSSVVDHRTATSTRPVNPSGATVTVAPVLPQVTVTTSGKPNTVQPRKGGLTVVTAPGRTVTSTSILRAPSASRPGANAPAVQRLRLAAGTAGVAVTSAAGFGFLMLRRRGRYGP